MTTMDKPRFKPWIGENYEDSNPKTLVLGESHYGDGSEQDDLTSLVVSEWGIDRKHAFFTRIAQATTGQFSELTKEEKYAFWHSIAFYNYIQDIVGPGPRIPPGSQHWVNAQEPFRQVMQALQPDVVIVLGLRMMGAIKQIESSYPASKFVYWYHPSGTRFKKIEAHRVLQETVQ